MGREAELAEIARQKAILDNAPFAKIFDRFGRPILLGAEYEYHDMLPVVFTVVEATPNLDRNAPRGQWLLRIEAAMVVTAMDGMRTAKLTLVQMPKAPPADDGKAASDAPAGPQGSIVLTDMDTVARETLAATEPASSEAQPPEAPPDAPPPALTLVPPPEAPPVDHGDDPTNATIDHGEIK